MPRRRIPALLRRLHSVADEMDRLAAELDAGQVRLEAGDNAALKVCLPGLARRLARLERARQRAENPPRAKAGLDVAVRLLRFNQKG
jgi:hypothetical protein